MVTELIETGELAAVTVLGVERIPRFSVDRFLADLSHQPRPGP
jgi:hypothetical protein